MDINKISNNGKEYDFVLQDASIKTIRIFELTLKKKNKITEILIEKIKEVNRKESLEFSKTLPESERIKYLVAASRANSKISDDEVNEASKSVYGLIEILKLASRETKLDWEQVFIDNGVTCLLAYFYAIGNEVKEEEIDKPEQSEQKTEVVQETKFCSEL